MKPFLIIFLCILTYYSNGQIKAFIKDSSINEFTIKEFKKESLVKLADPSLNVVSYVAYFTCDDPKNADCRYVSMVTVNSNSLYDSNFIKVMRKYKFKQHFNVVFDNIKYLNKNGDTVLAGNGIVLKISK